MCFYFTVVYLWKLSIAVIIVLYHEMVSIFYYFFFVNIVFRIGWQLLICNYMVASKYVHYIFGTVFACFWFLSVFIFVVFFSCSRFYFMLCLGFCFASFYRVFFYYLLQCNFICWSLCFLLISCFIYCISKQLIKTTRDRKYIDFFYFDVFR